MRTLLLLAGHLTLGTLVAAETVRLRKRDNGNIVDVEVVELLADKVSFRLPGDDTVHTVGWDSLDAAWIRRNSPGIWNEHELLLRAAQEKAEEGKPEPGADPFAKETPAADSRDLTRNLSSTLGDGLRGIDPGSIATFCRENGVEESAFWRGFDDLRRASGTLPEAKAAEGEKSAKASRGKDSGRDRQAGERDPAGQARESQLRAEKERGQLPLTGLGYVRTLAEGGYKGRLAWQVLRASPEDRKAIISRLRKYEGLAGELAERAEKAEARRDALVLRKLLGDVAGSFERISRENNTQEERLKSDCQSLLARLGTPR